MRPALRVVPPTGSDQAGGIGEVFSRLQAATVRHAGVAAMKATAEVRNYATLITDDDSNSRDALREIIQPEGFQTLLAASGEEAIDIVREAPVHLVLLDMHMPTLTGLETLQLVHQINAQLPAILVTGDPSDRLV